MTSGGARRRRVSHVRPRDRMKAAEDRDRYLAALAAVALDEARDWSAQYMTLVPF